MKWNQAAFVNNIELIVNEQCDGNQVAFVKKAGVGRDDVSRWKHGSRPRLEALLRVTEAFDCGLDWLITGKISGKDCFVACDVRIKGLCQKVKRVINSPTGFSPALEANIHAFDESVTFKETCDKLQSEVENLKEVISPGPSAGTPKVPARRTARRRKAG